MRRQFSPVVLTDRSVGGLSYTQPAITAAASYYKIMSGNPITFGWNFTNILYVPRAAPAVLSPLARSRQIGSRIELT